MVMFQWLILRHMSHWPLPHVGFHTRPISNKAGVSRFPSLAVSKLRLLKTEDGEFGHLIQSHVRRCVERIKEKELAKRLTQTRLAIPESYLCYLHHHFINTCGKSLVIKRFQYITGSASFFQ